MSIYRNQPSYDFLRGSPPPAAQTAREPLRASQAVRPDPNNEDLRAQIHKLQYDVESLKQQREELAIRHQEEVRALQVRADGDFTRAQTSESGRLVAIARTEVLNQDLEECRTQSAQDKRDAEKKLRRLQEENAHSHEEIDEIRSELSSQQRQSKHDFDGLRAKYEELQQALNDLEADRNNKDMSLQRAQQTLAERDATADEQNNEIIRLKALAGDVETMAVIKATLQEQVAHITTLETTTQKQQIELRQFRKQQKAIDIVEEEKKSLEAKVRMMYDLRKELSEMQLQRQILEDERTSWTAYLENVSATDEQLKFDSPEELARAYIQERSENASLVYEIGRLKPEVSSKDATIQSLEERAASLNEEMEKLRISAKPADNKAQARLERQRTLAVKEVEYLRAQLKMYDVEEGEFEPDKHDEQKVKRLQDLDNMVEQYRKEVQSLNEELKRAEEGRKLEEKQPDQQISPFKGVKRGHEFDNDERLGELTRKNRALQDDLTKIKTARTVLEHELAAHKSQLASLKASSRVRVLELRNNPAAIHESAKQSTLTLLRAENEALLAHLETQDPNDNDDTKFVPKTTVTRLRRELADKDTTIASRDKHILRLKQIFTAKSLEFREAVASILGWKLDFMPNGRVRATSMFNPGSTDEEDGEEGNYIVFDGEQGTMKVSGGPQSAFAGEIRSLIEFWVDGRKEIPCFLAACTLEFWEKGTRALKI